MDHHIWPQLLVIITQVGVDLMTYTLLDDIIGQLSMVIKSSSLEEMEQSEYFMFEVNQVLRNLFSIYMLDSNHWIVTAL